MTSITTTKPVIKNLSRNSVTGITTFKIIIKNLCRLTIRCITTLKVIVKDFCGCSLLCYITTVKPIIKNQCRVTDFFLCLSCLPSQVIAFKEISTTVIYISSNKTITSFRDVKTNTINNRMNTVKTINHICIQRINTNR